MQYVVYDKVFDDINEAQEFESRVDNMIKSAYVYRIGLNEVKGLDEDYFRQRGALEMVLLLNKDQNLKECIRYAQEFLFGGRYHFGDTVLDCQEKYFMIGKSETTNMLKSMIAEGYEELMQTHSVEFEVQTVCSANYVAIIDFRMER